MIGNSVNMKVSHVQILNLESFQVVIEDRILIV